MAKTYWSDLNSLIHFIESLGMFNLTEGHRNAVKEYVQNNFKNYNAEKLESLMRFLFNVIRYGNSLAFATSEDQLIEEVFQYRNTTVPIKILQVDSLYTNEGSLVFEGQWKEIKDNSK